MSQADEWLPLSQNSENNLLSTSVERRKDLPYRMQMECEGFEFTYGIEFLLSQLRDLGQVSSLFLSLSFPKMGIVPI